MLNHLDVKILSAMWWDVIKIAWVDGTDPLDLPSESRPMYTLRISPRPKSLLINIQPHLQPYRLLQSNPAHALVNQLLREIFGFIPFFLQVFCDQSQCFRAFEFFSDIRGVILLDSIIRIEGFVLLLGGLDEDWSVAIMACVVFIVWVRP